MYRVVLKHVKQKSHALHKLQLNTMFCNYNPQSYMEFNHDS